MKKLIVSLAYAAAMCAPFAARSDEGRVNLWPLVGYEDGALDVIWPLGHFESAEKWRFFPLFKDGSTFCVFPEVWLNRETFAVLPLYSRYDFTEGTLFPVLWWDFSGEYPMHSVFPLYYYNSYSDALAFWVACGLGGYRRHAGKTDHWLLPLYLKKDADFLSVPWSRVYGANGSTEAYLCGLAGREKDLKGRTTTHWCFPFWGKGEHWFNSAPYCCRWNGKGETEAWLSILGLSGGWQRGDVWAERYLVGLAGRNTDARTGFADSWCVPLYYADNQGTLVTPVYGQTKGAKWGLPGWYSDEHTFVSPLWYSHTDANGALDRWAVPPLLSGGVYRDGVRRHSFLLNAAGCLSDENGYSASWIAPFYFLDSDGTFVTPLYGRTKTSQWCFPLWYSDESRLYSPFWCQERDAEGGLERWAVPPLLSYGGTRKDGTCEAQFLLGLGGATWNGAGGFRSSWVFPFYREDSTGTFVTPLAGKCADSSWVFPLFYTDKDSFASLPYMRVRDDAKKATTYVIPPLLSGCTKHDDGGQDLCALLLYGHGSDAKGDTKHDYLLPLYWYNGQNNDFASLLYGRCQRGTHTNTWWATPLVGTRSGTKTGGWFFPFFDRTKDASFDSDLARLDAPTLPADLSARTTFVSEISSHAMIVSKHDSRVRGRPVGEKRENYEMRETSKQGNKLLFGRTSSRTVTYDIATRKRANEIVESETQMLGFVFTREQKENREKGTKRVHTRVLWKLWDREEVDGNVTLDAFPGFTYDAKADGYSKTSFLWRFFRYEKDPKAGTKLDLLFLPVVRSGK